MLVQTQISLKISLINLKFLILGHNTYVFYFELLSQKITHNLKHCDYNFLYFHFFNSFMKKQPSVQIGNAHLFANRNESKTQKNVECHHGQRIHIDVFNIFAKYNN